ncbi:MAG TPA: DinB family protein [Chloroflexota bacterium]|nr:DinB family protein [Chloroflexota bacterium]
MPENKEELLSHYRRMRADLLAAIDGLTDEQLTEESLDGWSVKDHLAHLAFWDDLRAAEVARVSAGHQAAWVMTPEQDEALNALAYACRREMSPAQAKWELAESRQRLVDAISSATPRGLDASLYGEAGLRTSHEAEHAGWIRRWRANRGAR